MRYRCKCCGCTMDTGEIRHYPGVGDVCEEMRGRTGPGGKAPQKIFAHERTAAGYQGHGPGNSFGSVTGYEAH